MSFKLFLILLIGIIANVKAQKKEDGKCPDVAPMENFNETQFAGRWYQWARTKNDIFHLIHTKCIYYEFTKILDNGQMIIATIQREDFSGLRTRNPYMVTPESPGAWKGPNIIDYEYRVVATDYDRFALVFACNTGVLSFKHDEIIYILTRKKEPDYATVFEPQAYIVYDLMRSLYDLELTDHDDCPEREEKLFEF